MTNYLSNAIHYAGGKKEISIRCREQEKNVRISVFNTGDPIPEEDIDKIWSKFYKVDKARTREYGGSGIGLSHCEGDHGLVPSAVRRDQP